MMAKATSLATAASLLLLGLVLTGCSGEPAASEPSGQDEAVAIDDSEPQEAQAPDPPVDEDELEALEKQLEQIEREAADQAAKTE